ncbi:MAG: PLP-dependent transferase [Chloroflexi bacterium]|nr:PLP-dependent transferase [Chloroflexota bacterium]
MTDTTNGHAPHADDDADRPWSFDTLAAHAGESHSTDDDGPSWRPTAGAIHNASGFFMPSLNSLDEVFAGSREGYFYTRDGNPTVRSFEEAVAALESAPMVGAFGSGMAAIYGALLAAEIRPGDHIVATQDMYGLTRVLLTGHLADFGVRTTFVDMTDLGAVEAALSEGAKVVYLETISNPLVKVLDLKALVALAKRYGAKTIVDNTFASPYLLRPIEQGADLVVHSATKYIGGHGDVTGGTVAAADETTGKRVRYQAKLLGAVLGPNEAWLAHRGLKTLSLRMARQCDNALAVAEWLAAQPGVERVYYPGLPAHPQHALANGMLGGRFGAMLAFDLKDGDRPRVGRFMDALQLVAPAPTLGDIRTLTLYPVVASHRGLTPEERRAVGIGDGLVRLSVGIEEPADICADLQRGLRAASASPVPSTTM